MKVFRICSLLLIIFGSSSVHGAPHDWSGITMIYLERGHESIKDMLAYKFFISEEGRVNQIEYKGSNGAGDTLKPMPETYTILLLKKEL